MTVWLAACLGLLPALAPPLLHACRGGVAGRLVAVQLAGTLAAILLALMTFAFDQPSSIDLAVALGLLSLPGMLLMAVFVERWL
jgi:multicomponent Na+:H+ antiporter subunit F